MSASVCREVSGSDLSFSVAKEVKSFEDLIAEFHNLSFGTFPSLALFENRGCSCGYWKQ